MIKLPSHILWHKEKKPKKTKKRKKRKRKIIRFNPPFSLNIKTNVGKLFLKLLKSHFPEGNTLHKIFNCNMEFIISSYNKQIVQPNDDNFECNCRTKRECPLECKCLS